MRIWLRRVFGILVLSLGIVCLVCPFRDYRVENVNRETIQARALGYVAGEGAEGGLSLAWNLDENQSGAIPPELKEAIDSVSAKDAEETSASFLAGMDLLMACLPPEGVPVETGGVYFAKKEEFVFEIRNPSAVFWKMILESASTVQTEGQGRISVSLAGRIFPPDAGLVIEPELWEENPGIAMVLDSAYRPLESSPPAREEWVAFLASSGGQVDAEGRARVIREGRLYQVEPTTLYLDEKQQVPRLQSAVRGIGVGGLFFGLLLLSGLYRSKRVPDAIQIGTPKTQLAGDLVVIVLASLAMTPPLDALLHRWFGTDPIADEEFILFMSVFFLLLAVPAVSLYLSLIGSQWFQASQAGVRLKSLFSDRFLEWNALEDVEVDRGTPLPAARSGLIVPRTLQKSLVFAGQGERIAVMEPSESRKREIVAKTLRHAPEALRRRIEEAGADWLGYEVW